MSNEAPQEDNGIPRGALIVVAVGLLACLAAVALATSKSSGAAGNLEWVQTAKIPDSRAVDVPGGGGTMRLEKGQIAATGTNVSGYSLFRVATTLRIDGGSPVGDAQILCVTKGGPRAEIARTSGGLRAVYPRSSEAGIFSQPAPEVLLLDFSARGGELVVVEAEDLLIPRFTSERGVKLEWPEYEEGTERLKYFIAGGKPKNDLVLPFYSVWKTTAVPSAEISCTVKTSAGKTTVSTAGGLKKISPPIDEEAEEEAEDRAEEEADELEEDEAEGDE
ncbi:MAG: hypothetical protein QOE75_2142 [Solirubrobacterales bacterium]|nr:hypothetical protein [Solirubrobacterales bacterium]